MCSVICDDGLRGLCCVLRRDLGSSAERDVGFVEEFEVFWCGAGVFEEIESCLRVGGVVDYYW